ncbi:MAG: hypothetical protein IJI53_02325 [Clostridia bacterium]|nr:hypothetical protein [Clostridia bacterium]
MSESRREEARTRYISGDETLRTLSAALGVGERTLQKWSKEDGWREKRKKFRERAARKAATKLVGKKAKELEKLLDASDHFESALQKAAAALDEDRHPERIADGKMRGKNMESLARAIEAQVNSRMMISGLLTRAEKEKLDLMRRKLEMEERKDKQEREENKDAVTIIMDERTKELAK